MRREWIEITPQYLFQPTTFASPSMRREWIEIAGYYTSASVNRSPSMRREWIEIYQDFHDNKETVYVSLHAEGVD